MSELRHWSWLFLVAYVVIMIGFGIVGRRRVTGADAFATARQAYGPLILALAFASTTASGATFLGIPGLAYQHGLSTLWYAFLYPIGVYAGLLLSQSTIGRYGNQVGARSIPEFLGERFQSDGLRLGAAIFSLILLFYLAAQLLAGIVMFQMMLGLSPTVALSITTLVLIVYVTMGGAHADILTDSAQAALMLVLAVAIIVMFFLGAGVDGGPGNLIDRLRSLDPKLTAITHPQSVFYDGAWALFAIFLSHVPLGLMPHIGNKLWALRSEQERKRFLQYAFVMGMIMPAMVFGGILCRAVLGDVLLESGGANSAIPLLFISLFPSWLAALLGIAILAAVMSTADGLVLSTSQVFANDLYRRTIMPSLKGLHSAADQDLSVLWVSRCATVVTLVTSMVVAWSFIGTNIALLVWVGIGGFTAALAGPLILGSIWPGATRLGAIWSFWSGAVVFAFLHSGLFPLAYLGDIGGWLAARSPSPFSCSAIGSLVSIAVLLLVSLVTRPMSEAHLRQVFAGRNRMVR